MPRQNTHQTHQESLVLLGKEGLDELNNKIEALFDIINGKKNTNFTLTNKIDGCLAPETLVKTTEGDVAFSKLINDYNVLGKVYKGYGKDDKTGEIKEVDLTLPRVINGNKEWCTIEFDNNSFITCTIDHPFKDDDHYTEANKLSINSKIDVI